MYSATGEKLKKVSALEGDIMDDVDYVNGVEYRDGGILSRIAHTEGSVSRQYNAATNVVSYIHEYVLRDHLGNTRVTFTDVNNDGAVTSTDIKQTNSYYPFGLNMEGNWNAQVSNSYQYNGKELNTDFGLNWNDYGARFYDPAMARWVAVDQLAEKYQPYSPYTYGGNNPIKFIDPDGRYIIILFGPTVNADGVREYSGAVTYKDGKLYDVKTKQEYTGGDSYVTKVKNDLAQLSKDDPILATMVSDLQKSKNIHTIEPPDPDNSDPNKKTNSTEPEDKKAASDGTGTGSSIVYDPDKTENDAGEERKPRAGLAHELGHGDDADKGTVPQGKTTTGVKMDEIKPVNRENRARAATNGGKEKQDPKKTTYGGKPIPPELLDNTHN